MAEYIDRDLAIKEWYKNSKLSKSARKIFMEMPTADVIERSKISRTIEEIKELYTEWENLSDDAKLETNPFGAVLNIMQRNIGE